VIDWQRRPGSAFPRGRRSRALQKRWCGEAGALAECARAHDRSKTERPKRHGAQTFMARNVQGAHVRGIRRSLTLRSGARSSGSPDVPIRLMVAKLPRSTLRRIDMAGVVHMGPRRKKPETEQIEVVHPTRPAHCRHSEGAVAGSAGATSAAVEGEIEHWRQLGLGDVSPRHQRRLYRKPGRPNRLASAAASHSASGREPAPGPAEPGLRIIRANVGECGASCSDLS